MSAVGAEIAAAAVGYESQTIIFPGGVRMPRWWFHPDWLARAACWWKFELVFRGGEAFIESKNPLTLFSHMRESMDGYQDRCRRAFYRNHPEAIIGLKADAIFQPQVNRSHAGDPGFEAWAKDVDLQGTNADPFFNDVARWAMAYGRYWVGITMPAAREVAARAAAEGRVLTTAEAIEAKLRPYYYTVSPLCVIDWSKDEYGCLEYAVVIEQEFRRRPAPAERDGQPEPRLIMRKLFRDREEKYAIGKNGVQAFLSSTPHAFGEVPIVPVQIRKDGRSQLEDIARLMIGVFNLDSMIMEQAARQTFNQLKLKLKDPAAGASAIIGTDSVLPLHETEDAEYFAPDVKTIAALREIAWEWIDEAWAMAHLRSRPGGKGSQPATDTSGVAFAYEWKAAEADLFGIATSLEEAELRLLGMRSRSLRHDAAKIHVAYPREFDIRALMARANEAAMLLKINLGKTAAGELRRGLVNKALPRVPAALRATINEEIDKIGLLEEKRFEAAPAGPGAPGVKLPNQPPNQGEQPPGEGSGEDRVDRAARGKGDAEDDDARPKGDGTEEDDAS